MFAVAIDGPSGVGKSSVSKAVAQELGFLYVDTGALYRTVGLYLLKNDVDPSDAQAVERALPGIRVEMRHGADAQHMLLCGEDVTDELRSLAVSEAASTAAALPAVRAHLLKLQTEIAARHDVVMDGRDIGTVVLPHAQVKVFLTASAEERARRRCGQMKKTGDTPDYEQVLAEVKARDERDEGRDVAPLRPADDSVLVDSTRNQKADTVGIIVGLVRDKLACDKMQAD